jgi:hypothetical protein
LEGGDYPQIAPRLIVLPPDSRYILFLRTVFLQMREAFMIAAFTAQGITC